MRLLIVDDHPANLRLLRAQLEAEGHNVLDASNGAEALKLLGAEAIDGIISDILMPEMDGYRLCMEVRGQATLCALPFVLYTSTYNSPGDRALALKAGADSYLTKPAPVPMILAALHEAAGKARTAVPVEIPPVRKGEVLKAYSEALVRKLEDSKQELELSLAEQGRRHGEERRADERYRLAFESLPAAALLTDSSGRVLSVNDELARLLGYSGRDQALGALRAEFGQAPAAERYWSALRQAGEARRVRFELRTADGGALKVLLDGRKLEGELDPSPLMVTVVQAD